MAFALLSAATAPISFLAFETGSAPEGVLRLDSSMAGERPGHRLTLDVRAGDPEVHRATLTYPEGFRFLGFQVLGPPHSPVGAYEVDGDHDGMPEVSAPLRSLSDETAYVDTIADGAFSRALEPVLRRRAGTGFELTLPHGGDGNHRTVASRFTARVSLSLAAGLLANPAIGGSYDVLCALITVDPDTDGPSDGAGDEPLVREFVQTVQITGPSIVPFAHLSIDGFDVKRHTRDRLRFSLRGRFELGASSDGLDVAREYVSVRLDWIRSVPARIGFARPGQSSSVDPSLTRWFSQTIRGADFTRVGHGFHFRSAGPGIERFRLSHDGRFDVDARDVALATPSGRMVHVTMRIGTDRGTAVAHIDEKGHGQW
jgi:hypothetical protein